VTRLAQNLLPGVDVQVVAVHQRAVEVEQNRVYFHDARERTAGPLVPDPDA
jgi:hypothetical protein